MRSTAIALLFAMLGVKSGWAYPWPVFPDQGTLEDPSPINAVIGEYRDTQLTNCPLPCPHLHDGVDIGRPAGTDVFPSLAGTVVIAAGEQVRVVSNGGTTMSYLHTVPDSLIVQALNASNGNGVPVAASDVVIATVAVRATGPHLHFREWDANATTANVSEPRSVSTEQDERGTILP